MNETRLELPFSAKISQFVFLLFGIICMFAFKKYILVFVFDIIVFLPLSYFALVKYYINADQIKIVYPILYKREYNVKDVIGYTFLPNGTDISLILFSEDNEKIKIKISGKKMKEYMKNFIVELNEKIIVKNINDINKNGLKIKIGKNDICFAENFFDLVDKDNVSKRYYYNKDISKIKFQEYMGRTFVKIITIDNKAIQFNDYMVKGNRGIFKHLMEKCPNDA
jgi:hypothetical protein